MITEILNYLIKGDISERLLFQSEKDEDQLIYIIFKLGSKLHKSNTYRFQSSSKLLSIDDCLFCLDYADLECLDNSLELKLFSKSRSQLDDSLVGYVNIDINQIFTKVLLIEKNIMKKCLKN